MKKLILSFALLSVVCYTVCGQMKVSTVQSIFLYSTTKYMEWPGVSADFVITVMGDEEIFIELQKIAQTRKVGVKNIIVKRAETVLELERSQIIFIGSSSNHLIEKIKESTSSQASLIVTNKEGLLNKGSDLNLLQKGDKMTFQLSEKTIVSKGIKVSSSFVSLADKI